MAIYTVTSYPKWRELPSDKYGDCCGLRPTVRYAKRQRLVLITCPNPSCPNHDDGVLAGPTDALAKWDRFRRTSTAPESTDEA